MTERLLDVFFYGLFMDAGLLRDKGVHPSDIRLAAVPGFALRIGARAALVPDTNAIAHGAVMKLSHADIQTLYSDPSVAAYKPEPVLADLQDGRTIAALCFNLPEAPCPDERNADYALKLRVVAQRVGLPGDYVKFIR